MLRHSLKSLQPSEMKLGPSFSPRLFSWLLLADPVHHWHSYSSVLSTHDTKSALPGQSRINFKPLMQCAIRSTYNPPGTRDWLYRTQTTLWLHCFVSLTLSPLLGGGRSAARALTPHCLSLLCLPLPKRLLFKIGAPPSPLLLRPEGVYVFPGIGIHLAEMQFQWLGLPSTSRNTHSSIFKKQRGFLVCISHIVLSCFNHPSISRGSPAGFGCLCQQKRTSASGMCFVM